MMKLAKSLLSAVLVIMLVLTMGVSAFAYNDVDAAGDSYEAIEFVDRLGIIQSTWNGDFKPDQYLTRADALVAVYRTITGGQDINPADYADVPAVSYVIKDGKGDIAETSILRHYLAWAVDNFLIASTTEDGLFKPSEAITANELLTLLSKIAMTHDDAAVFPDSYADSLSDIVTNVEPGDTPVTREDAAVAFAAAIVAADGSAGKIGEYVDFDGEPLNSLATKAFKMSSVDLVIRATTGRNLGYEVKNGVLLSNGADVDLGDDLSEYVGYGINIVYRDADNSKTYTEDEEILTYSVSSTGSTTVSVGDVVISSGSTMSVNAEGGSVYFGTGTYFYLNDAPWPNEDPKYDLVGLVPSIDKSAKVLNRPGFKFKCLLATEGDTVYSTVFATETKPGKIVGINNGYYTVYDYYYADTDNAYRTYKVTDCVFSSVVKVGDYVTFYESAGKCYFNAGNTLVSPAYAFGGEIDDKGVEDEKAKGKYTLADGLLTAPHAFFTYGDTPLVYDKEGKGPQYNFIFDDSGEKYLVTWEAVKTNYAQLIVKEATHNMSGDCKIVATNLSTNQEVTFTVPFANINSPHILKAGDFIDYCDNGAETDPVRYVSRNASKTVEVKDMGDYFIELNSDKVYYKNQHYAGEVNGLDFTSGTCTLNLDMANTVVSIVVA